MSLNVCVKEYHFHKPSLQEKLHTQILSSTNIDDVMEFVI